MNKPIILKLKDFEEKVVNLINESELPAFMVRPAIEKIYNQILMNEQKEVNTALEQFNDKKGEKDEE